jgi:hypothetical protein
MKHGVLITCLVLLLNFCAGRVVIAAPDTVAPNQGADATTTTPVHSQNSSEQREDSFEEWTRRRARPWMSCVIFGTYSYARYFIDKSNLAHFVLFSEYLEKGDCFYRDLEWAAEIYRDGAKAGKEVHALYLGYLYLKGISVKRDVDEAKRWFDLGVLYRVMAAKKDQIHYTRLVMGHRGMQGCSTLFTLGDN